MTPKLEMVVHTCHPNYARGASRRIVVQASLGKKSMKPYLKNN
jgi:hypothetical protein